MGLDASARSRRRCGTIAPSRPGSAPAVRGPLPEIPLWVSGLVQPNEAQAYLAAGAQIVGLNTASLPQTPVEAGDWAAVAEAARAMLAEARG